MLNIQNSFRLFVVLLGFAFGYNVQAAENIAAKTETKSESARQVVEQFQKTLLDVMQHGSELGFDGRYKKLAPAVKKSHALTKIARIVVGREWKKLTEETNRRTAKKTGRYIYPLEYFGICL